MSIKKIYVICTVPEAIIEVTSRKNTDSKKEQCKLKSSVKGALRMTMGHQFVHIRTNSVKLFMQSI